ncbi:MAG: hypothetical protein AAFR11_14500 [Pseudomonadota bacterium]
MKRHLVLWASAALVAGSVAGCATGSSVGFQNASPIASIPAVAGVPAIPATVVVSSTSADNVVDNDVVAALRRNAVFKETLSGRTAGAGGDLQLIVSSENSQNENGMGRAVTQGLVSGLTFGAASFAQKNEDWYEVKITATLKDGARVIKTYETVGRIETVVPGRAPLKEKIKASTERVTQAYDHALNLLSAELKLDRPAIMSEL